MRRVAYVALLVACVFGCHRKEEPKTEAPPPSIAKTGGLETSTDPAEKLREQLRSAAVQLDPATEKIQEALKAAQELAKSPYANKEFKQAMADVGDSLDSAGSTLGDFTAEPAELAEFKKDVPSHQKDRVNAINACNDAINDLKDAANIVDSVAQSANPKLQNPLEGVSGPIDEALSTVRDALTELGGKEEQLDEDSGDTGTSDDQAKATGK